MDGLGRESVSHDKLRTCTGDLAGDKTHSGQSGKLKNKVEKRNESEDPGGRITFMNLRQRRSKRKTGNTFYPVDVVI